MSKNCFPKSSEIMQFKITTNVMKTILIMLCVYVCVCACVCLDL